MAICAIILALSLGTTFSFADFFAFLIVLDLALTVLQRPVASVSGGLGSPSHFGGLGVLGGGRELDLEVVALEGRTMATLPVCKKLPVYGGQSLRKINNISIVFNKNAGF